MKPMPWNLTLVLLPWLLLSLPAAAYPVLGAAREFDLLASEEDAAVALLPDGENDSLFYVTPKRVALATDPHSGRPLFRLSFTPQDGGEFVGVFALEYDEQRAEKQLAEIRRSRPQAEVRPLPLLRGHLLLELQSSNGTADAIAQAEVVSSAFPHGLLPFSIHISPEGMELIRLQLASPLQAFLTLRFVHQSHFQMGSLEYTFRFQPRKLFSSYRNDMEERWPPSGLLSPTTYRSYWTTRYMQTWEIASLPDEVNLKSASALFVSLLDLFFSEQVGTQFDLRRREDTQSLSADALSEGPVTLDGSLSGRVAPTWGSAGVLLSGLCGRHADLVYFEADGREGCSSLLLRPVPPLPDGGGVWNPW